MDVSRDVALFDTPKVPALMRGKKSRELGADSEFRKGADPTFKGTHNYNICRVIV